MESNYESALINKDNHVAEPWSVTWVTPGDHGKLWVSLLGSHKNTIAVTEGELEILELLDEDNRVRVVEHWKNTRKKAPEWESRFNVPFQQYKFDF